MSKDKHRPCPGCNAETGKSIGSKNGFELLVCKNCQTIYTDHLPKESEAEKYDEYYSELNLTVPDFIAVRVEEIVSEFSEFRQTNRFLDIGFGAGSVLHAARCYGWEAFGLEVSKPAVEQAKNFGFEVFHGDITEAKYPSNYFDVVTASEILEHLMDPISFLSEVARILRPGGMFWATTPSARSLSYRLLNLDWSILSPPEHIQLYSTKAVSAILKEAGFEIIKLRTYGLNPMEIFRHYHTSGESHETFNRVEAGYRLNESLTKNPVRKKIKNLFNHTLNIMRLGDSLKIYAQTKVSK